jgi:hypothetical protein
MILLRPQEYENHKTRRLESHNVKVKVKFTLEQATKAQKGNRCIAVLFNFGARWGGCINATPRPLYPWERPGTHCIGSRVGTRAGLDECGKSHPYRDSIPGPSSP